MMSLQRGSSGTFATKCLQHVKALADRKTDITISRVTLLEIRSPPTFKTVQLCWKSLKCVSSLQGSNNQN